MAFSLVQYKRQRNRGIGNGSGIDGIDGNGIRGTGSGGIGTGNGGKGKGPGLDGRGLGSRTDLSGSGIRLGGESGSLFTNDSKV